MAKYVARQHYIEINGTAYSDHASEITINDEAERIDVTSFGPSGYREYAQGLSDASIDVTFFQDFASASIHAVFQALKASGGTFSVKVKPDSSATGSATNPVATMIGRVYTYGGIGGKVGEANEVQVQIANAGTAGITWGTA